MDRSSADGTVWTLHHIVGHEEPEGTIEVLVSDLTTPGGPLPDIHRLCSDSSEALDVAATQPLSVITSPKLEVLCMSSTASSVRQPTTGDTVYVDVRASKPLHKAPTGEVVLGSGIVDATSLDEGAGLLWRISRKVEVTDPPGPVGFTVHCEGGPGDPDGCTISKLPPDQDPVTIVFAVDISVSMRSSTGGHYACPGDTVWLDIATTSLSSVAPPVGYLVSGTRVTASPVEPADAPADHPAGDTGVKHWRISHVVKHEDRDGPADFWVRAAGRHEGAAGPQITSLADGQAPIRVYHPTKIAVTMSTTSTEADGKVRLGDIVTLTIVAERPLISPPVGAIFAGAAAGEAMPVDAGTTWELRSAPVTNTTPEGPVEFWCRTHEYGIDGLLVVSLADGAEPAQVELPVSDQLIKNKQSAHDVQRDSQHRSACLQTTVCPLLLLTAQCGMWTWHGRCLPTRIPATLSSA